MDTDDELPRRVIVRSRSLRVLRRSGDPASTNQKFVGTVVIGMLRQRRPFQGCIELSMKREPPALDIIPGHLTSANRQKTIAIIVHTQRNKPVPQNRDAR